MNTKKPILDARDCVNFLTPQIEINFDNFDKTKRHNIDKLNNQISKTYKILKEQFEIFNGCFGGVYSIFNRLKPTHCTIYAPCDREFINIASKFNCEISLINRFENIDTDINNDTLVIFANPSFPDGKFYNLEKLLLFWKNKNATVLIDESFLEFTNEKSLSESLYNFPNIYILKSFDKFYGYTIGSLSLVISTVYNIKTLKLFEPTNKLSVFDIRYLSEILEDKIFKKITKTLIVKNSILLEHALRETGLCEFIYPSRVNFLLVKLLHIKSKTITTMLEKKGILILDCQEIDFLDDSFILITLKSEEDTKRLKIDITEALENKK